ncbi:hypothetical protein C2845_PM05G13890 [Panicum miliaceum]|uniref:DUF6598 domain-containing protein n=1 Tax=Panicum miliaceum TaxID=4540 RepID=A0A3L6T079_PANMI|nr:hypothetical protein C2845_PM05G13890 [Panicum miliaceum]
MASAAGDPSTSVKDLCVNILEGCAKIQTLLLELKESLLRNDAAVRLHAAARGFLARRRAQVLHADRKATWMLPLSATAAEQQSQSGCPKDRLFPVRGMARLSLTGPARVISMTNRALIETNGDDNLIIEECTQIENMFKSESFVEHRRLYGERCALDIKYMVVMNAVEAQVEVTVLHLGARPLLEKGLGWWTPVIVAEGRMETEGGGGSPVTSSPGSDKSWQPSPRTPPDGDGDEWLLVSDEDADCENPVETHNYLDLYIEGSSEDNPVLGRKEKPATVGASRSWWKCSFGSDYHDMDKQVAELGEFAVVSVNVNWKSYKKKESLRE